MDNLGSSSNNFGYTSICSPKCTAPGSTAFVPRLMQFIYSTRGARSTNMYQHQRVSQLAPAGHLQGCTLSTYLKQQKKDKVRCGYQPGPGSDDLERTSGATVWNPSLVVIPSIAHQIFTSWATSLHSRQSS
jgi:hypothetical protein